MAIIDELEGVLAYTIAARLGIGRKIRFNRRSFTCGQILI